LMMGNNSNCPSWTVPVGLADAHYIGYLDLGYGRLDTYQAMLTCNLL